jgi:hypothetical protein
LDLAAAWFVASASSFTDNNVSTTQTNISLTATPAGTTRRFSREVVLRFALVAVAVGVCYLFEWRWLRVLTLQLNSWVDGLAGVHLHRVGFDTVEWRGAIYKYQIACTFADVWCGAIPLIWNLRKSVVANVAYILAVGVVLIAFNVVRLSFSDVLYAWGMSWDLAHNVVSGISYFLIWTWIWRNRTWGLGTTGHKVSL